MQLEFRHLQLMLASLLILTLIPSSAFAQEPSPIDIQLVVPAQVGPGKFFEVQIKYDAVDLNAGADLNYNVFGPCRIWSRSPEPPNPIVNTWKPGPDAAQGVIKIQILVDEGTDGQTIRHQVEVRWGPKVRTFEATTTIKYVPPTATPTATPRPTRPPVKPTPVPPMSTPTPADVPAGTQVSATLAQPTFVNANGEPVSAVTVNQTLGLALRYTSSTDLENVRLIIRFDPDIVNLDNYLYIEGQYVIELPTLNAATQETALFASPLSAHIRSYTEGGQEYSLQATVSLVLQDGTVIAQTQMSPVQVSQPTTVDITASVETQVVQAGGGIILHVVCANPGSVAVQWLKLQLEGLPEGFVLTPAEQSVDVIEAGGRVERLFTIRVPDNFAGLLTFNVVGLLDGTRIEAAPITVELAPPAKLVLDAVAGQTQVKAGQVVYVNVICTNEGRLTARQVTIKLIDVSGSLGVLFQDLGDIAPGESRQAVFVVEIPKDFAASAGVSLAAQAIAADGTVSQSPAVEVAVTCVPALALEIKSPPVRVRAGQSTQVVVGVTNVSQCAAQNVTVSVVNLPPAFAQPAAQNLLELGPGQTRLLSFNLSVPKGYQGEIAFDVQAEADGGVVAPTVGGKVEVSAAVSTAFAVLFWSLVVIALIAIVVGLAMYFKNR